MGIRTAFRMMRDQRHYEAAVQAAAGDPSTLPVSSPFSPASDLPRIVFEDIFGRDLPMNTRAAAMRLGPIARGRNLITSTIARMPIATRNAKGEAPTPAWRTNTRGASVQHRLLWTVDDLIFYGWSCWKRENNADTFPGIGTERVNQGDWTVNQDGRVEIHGIEQRDTDVILIPGFHEGILTFGRDVLESAKSLDAIVRQRLKSPVPLVDLHQTGGVDMNKEERAEFIDLWLAARNDPTKGGVGFSSKDIEVKELGKDGDAQLMIEARNASALDLARTIGVTAALLDATAPKASLNYETATGRNMEFVDRDLQLYMEPIRARLSQDDVLQHGQSAFWDLTDFTVPVPPSTGTPLAD